MFIEPLTQFSVLNIEGDDAGEFLHSQLTNDVNSMIPGESRLAAYCDPAGRVLAVLLIVCELDRYLLVVNSSLEKLITKRMQIYVLRSSVTISSCSETHILHGFLAGEDEPEGCRPYPPDESRKLILLARAESMDPLVGELTGEQWLQADIESGLAWLDAGTTGRFLPQALNLLKLGAVDFNKGCYPGQEIVARVHYLGSVKRELVRLSIPAPDNPSEGNTLFYQDADGVEIKAGDIVVSAHVSDKIVILSIFKTDSYNDKVMYYIK